MIRLNRHVRNDIQWWLTFMNTWNGISLFWKLRSASLDVQVWSDTSGSWGCGVLIEKWFVFQWPELLHSLLIAHKAWFTI